MSRLNIDRQILLEPKRMDYAKRQIESKGYEVKIISNTQLQFTHTNNHVVNFFPYSGWASGSSIKDGRGLNKLLKQI